MDSESNEKNMEKYERYKEHNQRLTKAMKNEFYFEAIFIEYAILEDRLSSILRYEGNSINSKKHVSIEKKISKVKTIAREKKGLAQGYFTDEFMDSLLDWKGKRNKLIHGLMESDIHSDGLQQIAEEGKSLVKEINRLSKNYKNAVLRKEKSKIKTEGDKNK